MNRPRPTMADVARKVGVSAMTVSRALRDDPRVSARTRDTIKQAVETMGYVLDRTAGSLSSRRSGFVACLIPSLNSFNFSDTIRGLTEVLEAADMQLMLGYTNYAAEREEKLVQTMLEYRPAAFVIAAGDHTARTRRMLEHCGVPVVQFCDTPDHPINHVVGYSNIDAGYDLVGYLYARGYRKIGYIGSESNDDAREAKRFQGFKRAASEYNLDNERVIKIGSPVISTKQCGKAIDEMFIHWPNTDAIFCSTDSIAAGAIAECARRSWSVPDKVAIAGFGDFEIADVCYPSITTVNVDWRRIGATAGDIALQAIAAMESEDEITDEFIRTSHQIVARQSA